MGNTSSDQKVITTVWLGVTNSWDDKTKVKLSNIELEGKLQLQNNLKFEYKLQNEFIEVIQKILNKDSEKLLQSKPQSTKFLSNNEYLLKFFESTPNQSEQSYFTISSSSTYNVENNVNLSLSQSQFSLPAKEDELTNQQLQYLLIMEVTQNMLQNENYPFSYMIHFFSKLMINKINGLIEDTNTFGVNYTQLKGDIAYIGKQINLFAQFLIESLDDYLTDSVTYDNSLLKDYQNFYNLMIANILNNQFTIMLIEINKIADLNFTKNFRQKLVYFRQQGLGKTEYFDIPQRLVNNMNILQKTVSTLKEIQFNTNPSEKLHTILKIENQIKKYLKNKNLSNYAILQITNYIVINAQIATLQSEYNMLTLFYKNCPQLQRFGQSLEFIQNIAIS